LWILVVLVLFMLFIGVPWLVKHPPANRDQPWPVQKSE
jgi:hypothetical protein